MVIKGGDTTGRQHTQSSRSPGDFRDTSWSALASVHQMGTLIPSPYMALRHPFFSPPIDIVQSSKGVQDIFNISSAVNVRIPPAKMLSHQMKLAARRPVDSPQKACPLSVAVPPCQSQSRVCFRVAPCMRQSRTAVSRTQSSCPPCCPAFRRTALASLYEVTMDAAVLEFSRVRSSFIQFQFHLDKTCKMVLDSSGKNDRFHQIFYPVHLSQVYPTTLVGVRIAMFLK